MTASVSPARSLSSPLGVSSTVLSAPRACHPLGAFTCTVTPPERSKPWAAGSDVQPDSPAARQDDARHATTVRFTFTSAAQLRRRAVRCMPRILAPVGIGPFGMAAAPVLPPSACRRPSSASIRLPSMLRGSLLMWRSSGQRHLTLVVADDDLVDRGVADDAGGLLLLLCEQLLDTAGIALGDEDDARLTDHAMYGVEMGGTDHGLPDAPLATHVAQCPAGRTWLPSAF